MSHKMRVRKGDLVHMLSGKDRGKQGRVIAGQKPVCIAGRGTRAPLVLEKRSS